MAKKRRTWDGKAKNDNDTKYSKPFIWFVRVLFGVIIGNGFRTFASHFSFQQFIDTPDHVQAAFAVYFITGYFFVISDFIFYHSQIERYPYRERKIGRFFEDVVIFFLLYLLIYLASMWPTPRRLWGFILLLAVWHYLVLAWQWHVNWQYSRLRRRGLSHLWRGIIYLLLFCVYSMSQPNFPPCPEPGLKPNESVNQVIYWVWAIIILIGISNGIRLYTFVNPEWWFVKWLKDISETKIESATKKNAQKKPKRKK